MSIIITVAFIFDSMVKVMKLPTAFQFSVTHTLYNIIMKFDRYNHKRNSASIVENAVIYAISKELWMIIIDNN